MNCTEFKAIASSLALGACDADERAQAEAHLAEAKHDGCFEALHDANDAAALLAKMDPPLQPAPEIWDRVNAGLGHRPPRRRFTLLAYGGYAIAAGVLIAFAFSVTKIDDRLERDRRTIADLRQKLDLQARAFAMMSEAGAEVVVLGAQPGADAQSSVQAVINKDKRAAMIVAHGVKARPDKDYELWVIRGDQKLAAGLMKPAADGSAMMQVDPKLLEGAIDAFAITLEPPGGGAAPQGPALWVGAPKT